MRGVIKDIHKLPMMLGRGGNHFLPGAASVAGLTVLPMANFALLVYDGCPAKQLGIVGWGELMGAGGRIMCHCYSMSAH